VPITLFILVALFAVQSHGTAKVAAFFGPIMAFWFIVMAAGGIAHISDDIGVLNAINPFYGLSFLLTHKIIGLVTLGAVFLAVTGARGALCRFGPFRPPPDPDRLAGLRAAGARLNYFGQGGLGARLPRGRGQSLLQALSRLGADPHGGVGHLRDGDRQPGGDHRGLLAHASGGAARLVAAHGHPFHLGGPFRTNLSAARQRAAAGGRLAACAHVSHLKARWPLLMASR
jgi:hypothetical protein